MNHGWSGLALVVGTGLWTACAAVRGNHRAHARVEVEVQLEVGDAFRDRFDVYDGPNAALVRSAVLDEADLDLRCYPMATEAYADAQVRPRFRMIVRLDELSAEFDAPPPGDREAATDAAAATAAPSQTVRAWVCKLSVTFERRRDVGPPLIVGQAHVRHVLQRADRPESSASSDRIELLVGEPKRVRSMDPEELRELVRGAMTEAEAQLAEPIDLEFEAVDRPIESWSG